MKYRIITPLVPILLSPGEGCVVQTRQAGGLRHTSLSQRERWHPPHGSRCREQGFPVRDILSFAPAFPGGVKVAPFRSRCFDCTREGEMTPSGRERFKRTSSFNPGSGDVSGTVFLSHAKERKSLSPQLPGQKIGGIRKVSTRGILSRRKDGV